ncbi:twin-arginine translocase TatA/TatE family subunit [Alienimonas californiensis]|uniref:Sec-independent protein translocase protein TatA n=1 Tax=Alienimonas californiensis TaxID=2527989 RepID=A0A517P9F7_9PLAN|nr:twin-arginine translocase TatA/TatE family subunit [Alienimonas californiensis]QDT16010.1 twin arginine translocase protein A [Alienimonas californiensis]
MFPPPLAFGMPGLPEMAIFAVIVLVLFGKRLPGAMRSLGQSVGALKQGLNESEALDDEPAPPAVKPTTKTPTAA